MLYVRIIHLVLTSFKHLCIPSQSNTPSVRIWLRWNQIVAKSLGYTYLFIDPYIVILSFYPITHSVFYKSQRNRKLQSNVWNKLQHVGFMICLPKLIKKIYRRKIMISEISEPARLQLFMFHMNWQSSFPSFTFFFFGLFKNHIILHSKN